ncbi:hypothetical protein DY251_06875 [Mesorhizobium denitrificans]|uniref:Acetophenone carboxylase-like C-terminal domain-containing protein n=1 Tax=Mesorhizobium denitrificans TaxID=2294114 RepID=A0A371XHH6_9HYPH|nr:hypothetical protein DY251_06875 [Mesorhizobium denitrificans]
MEINSLARSEQSARLPARAVRFLGTGWLDAEVWRLEAIPEAQSIHGPAIIESDFTSIVVDPGAVARRDASGNLIISI